jgi:hypothetical protein
MKAVEDLACYLVRVQRLVYLDGQQAVLYRSRMNPSLGRNFEAMDPLEWLAPLAGHIPDPGRHRTHFYAHCANRVRGERPPEEATNHDEEELPTRAPLVAHLGTAHGQGVSGGSARLQTLRRPAQGRGLHHRLAGDQADPGPSRHEPAREATSTPKHLPARSRHRRPQIRWSIGLAVDEEPAVLGS